MSKKNINDEISRCIIQMLVNEPFYAHFLSGIVRKVTDEIPTAAVGLNNTSVTLYVNENFFLKELTTFSSRVAVIKHETLHILFKHLFRLDLKKYDRRLFNIAADLVVNQFIGKWSLPKSAVTLSSFPDYDLKEDKSVEWYYNKLLKLRNQKKHTESSKVLDNLLDGQTHSDHSKWKNGNDSHVSKHAETELDRLIVQTKNRITRKQYSLLPNKIQDKIDIIIQKRKAKIDWRRALKIFSASSRKTKIKFTNKRVSKRFGTRPGTKVKRTQKIAVAIDTSSSIPLKDFSLFFNEIYSMWRYGAEIEIIECDDNIQRVYNFIGKFPTFIQGRGGPAVDPVFEYINKEMKNLYDGCIYLTDGYASFPSIKPRCKVFWVITPEGEAGSLSKMGRVIKIDNY